MQRAWRPRLGGTDPLSNQSLGSRALFARTHRRRPAVRRHARAAGLASAYYMTGTRASNSGAAPREGHGPHTLAAVQAPSRAPAPSPHAPEDAQSQGGWLRPLDRLRRALLRNGDSHKGRPQAALRASQGTRSQSAAGTKSNVTSHDVATLAGRNEQGSLRQPPRVAAHAELRVAAW